MGAQQNYLLENQGIIWRDAAPAVKSSAHLDLLSFWVRSLTIGMSYLLIVVHFGPVGCWGLIAL